MPCHWCIPFVLRNHFLFLGERSRLVFFNVQPTSITTQQSSTEIASNLEEQLQDCNCCKKEEKKGKNDESCIFVPGEVKLLCD